MTNHQKRITRDEYVIRSRWIQSYPNGQTVTSEPRESKCYSLDEVADTIKELETKSKPMQGMRLQFKVYHLTEELLNERQ